MVVTCKKCGNVESFSWWTWTDKTVSPVCLTCGTEFTSNDGRSVLEHLKEEAERGAEQDVKEKAERAQWEAEIAQRQKWMETLEGLAEVLMAYLENGAEFVEWPGRYWGWGHRREEKIKNRDEHHEDYALTAAARLFGKYPGGPKPPSKTNDPKQTVREIYAWAVAVAALCEQNPPTPAADTQDLGADRQKADEIIEIQIAKFSKGPSKQLLRDLASCPSGVTYNEKQHGKKQPDTLKERFKDTEYEQYRDFFHRKGQRIWCDKNIRLI